MLQNLSGAEPVLRVPDQQFGDEVFGTPGDMSPLFLRKLIFALLDTLKQRVLRLMDNKGKEIDRLMTNTLVN